MPFLIQIRTQKSQRPFRTMLYKLISAKTSSQGNSLIVASGYFDEAVLSHRDYPEQRSIESEILLHLRGGLVGTWGPPINVSNLPNQDPFWKHHKFAKRLHSVLTTKVKYKQFIANDLWHAKLAIRYSDGKPIAALVGSSNMTKTTFPKTARYDPQFWNIESDVLIWSDVTLDALFLEPYDEENGILFTGRENPNDSATDLIDDVEHQLQRLSNDVIGSATDATSWFTKARMPGSYPYVPKK
jgi:hypothetical protein